MLTGFGKNEQAHFGSVHDPCENEKRQRGRITLNGMLNLFELSSLLGRRACGPPEDPQERIRLQQIEAALLKVYGPKALP